MKFNPIGGTGISTWIALIVSMLLVAAAGYNLAFAQTAQATDFPAQGNR